MQTGAATATAGDTTAATTAAGGPPPQWVALQYPPPPQPPPAAAAGMVMRHHPMMILPPPPPPIPYGRPPPAFLPYAPLPPPPPQQQQQQGGGLALGEDNRTIWVGDLHYWMDETYLHSCFIHTGDLVSTKVIRNKQTGQSEGYGFVEFHTHATAEKVLQNFNGLAMPTTDQPFRLNWASFSMGEKRSDAAPDHSIFVGDLASDVTDSLLQETFASKYPSVKGAKVVIDAITGRSRGYGFVRFGDDNEKLRAMAEMNGVFCSSRPMRICAATPRKSSGGFTSNGTSGHQQDGDTTNTTVFVGGLDPNVSEDELRQAFSQYGEIFSVKIPVGKQCGFVQFVNRNDAEEALNNLNRKVIGKQTIRLSWGRSPASKQVRSDSPKRWSRMYYGGNFYSGYGYGMPFQDPGMYAAAYGPYSMYGSQQQVS